MKVNMWEECLHGFGLLGWATAVSVLVLVGVAVVFVVRRGGRDAHWRLLVAAPIPSVLAGWAAFSFVYHFEMVRFQACMASPVAIDVGWRVVLGECLIIAVIGLGGTAIVGFVGLLGVLRKPLG